MDDSIGILLIAWRFPETVRESTVMRSPSPEGDYLTTISPVADGFMPGRGSGTAPYALPSAPIHLPRAPSVPVYLRLHPLSGPSGRQHPGHRRHPGMFPPFFFLNPPTSPRSPRAITGILIRAGSSCSCALDFDQS